ncbi:HNH endonuclease family protein [Actinoplanes sp. NPDC051346]|uniref:HNH endonuclease family protein n=1 Tax=Actinoplanes sp. NPDC051346 TaxID=3155048 RepID=UPI0034227357
MRFSRATAVAVVAVAATAAVAVPALADDVPAVPTVPAVPSKAVAQEQLNALAVDAEGSGDGYSREKFPHWENVEGSCNTRETVLQRDGDAVVVDNSCQPTSGTWRSPYDGETWTDAADVDIDHLVPLAEAWRSGADAWTTERREQFANDLAHPQLVAVTDDLNQAKGDQDPAEWQPPRADFQCAYAKMWITVKHSWQLTLQDAEKSALQATLDGCAS